jgi:hypothetical protein
MLQVSSFSSCTFLHTHIPNMAPWLSSMVHNISIDYSCAPNKLLSKELCPLEVNWCQNFTLTVLVVTFSYELCFAPRVAHWIALFDHSKSNSTLQLCILAPLNLLNNFESFKLEFFSRIWGFHSNFSLFFPKFVTDKICNNEFSQFTLVLAHTSLVFEPEALIP